MKAPFRFIFLAIWSLAIQSQSKAQIQSNFDVEGFAEELFATQDEDLDYEQLYENLLQRFLNPIDLNKCTLDDLQSLYILSPLQLNNFMDYRESFGKFLSIYELQAIPEFDLVTVKKLLPFVSISAQKHTSSKNLFQRITQEETAYIIYRYRRFLETRKGFTPPDTLSNGSLTSRYIGSPGAHYLRLRSQHAQDFSIGITLDKDDGESFTWNPKSRTYGFNFFSYHLALYNQGNFQIITLGDYQAQYGQGLVFGAGFSIGKGAETITTTRRSSTGIRPYTSSMEFGFFRGIASTYQKGKIEASIMISDVSRDANISLDEPIISSLPESGYHRTATEIERKANTAEKNFGLNVNYSSSDRNFQLGINSLVTKFQFPYIREDQAYNQFEFRGQNNHTHSVYWSYNFQNHFLFGEGAVSKSGGKAVVAGLMSSLSPHWDLVLHIRNYDRNFHSFYGNAFGESSRPINEKGIYLGTSFHPNKQWKWSAYFDQFEFPWLRYRSYAPSSGHEWLQRLTYSPKKAISIYFQVREEVKDRNITSTDNDYPIYQLSTGKRRNYLINLDYQVSKVLAIRSRVQMSSFEFNHQLTKGYTIVQDVSASLKQWNFSGRVALFDTDDYENRQYVFEKNVLWAFSIPSYYGQGMRYYLLAQYKMNRKLTFWTRWSRTTYTDRNVIGSGLQEIEGHRITELTFQLRYQFNK
ncbi:helix-hairpin-helix domain-containing protein [Echinicola sp. CAU 1574]|uniref:Helix-hairpin-helix domain-containing protein n=1 Tax=Echinicola arenosa TaxID=2774144 RepID=A0ABR9AFL4_9BACT|nr:helix-hairpin-helix domain-containing protein [Echinicola arenosa]MBD8487632.1 helix-hairpin-helix domain-containing protein [Echinicola arenosa]